MDALVQQVIADVYALQTQRVRGRRSYLGLSSVGHDCLRALWYSHRHAYHHTHEPRMLRLFETGNREEDRIVAELKAAGYEVQERDPQTRKQWEVSSCGGHVKGHFDGKILVGDVWLLLEIKTSNTSGFRALQKHGVRTKKPIHYAQMQTYMYFGGLDGALYICHCKERDELYAEHVPYDEEQALHYIDRANGVVSMEQPPEKLRTNMGWPCTMCDFAAICHDTSAPSVDCRTCLHAEPDTVSGGWRCHRWGQKVPDAFLADACDNHVYISPLLEHRHGGVVAYDLAEVDQPVLWVEYQDNEGKRVRNGAGGLTSREIAAIEVAPLVEEE